MGYQMVTLPMMCLTPKVLWSSTVGYSSDSFSSCYITLHPCTHCCRAVNFSSARLSCFNSV